MMRKLAIDDTSDCAACTRRDAEAMELIGEVRCAVLENVTCPECGRSVDVLVQESPRGGA